MSKKRKKKDPLGELKRAVIKEELVDITGDPVTAIVLNQFVHCTERLYGSKFYETDEPPERERLNQETGTPLQDGWVYKKVEDLIDECMLKMPSEEVEKHIKKLVSMGILKINTYPNEYKVDLERLFRLLIAKGYDIINCFLQK